MNEEIKIVHLFTENWNDHSELEEKFLKDIEEDNRKELKKEILWSEVIYDMAIWYCITCTESYMKEHHLEELQAGIQYRQFSWLWPKWQPELLGTRYNPLSVDFSVGWEKELQKQKERFNNVSSVD